MVSTWNRSAAALGAGALLAVALAGGGACSRAGGSSPVAPEGPMVFGVGGNDPRVIVAFGDSITVGQDSTDGKGYRSILERKLARAGRSGLRIVNEGIGGTFARDGAARIGEVLERDRPAALLLMYGTNDQGRGLPQELFQAEAVPTSEHLRRIIVDARANRTLVVLATLPPVCGQSRQAQRANIVTMNDKIRELGTEMALNDFGVMLVDPWQDMLAAAPPDGCDLISRVSNNHPNDAGYAVLAESFYSALKHVAW